MNQRLRRSPPDVVYTLFEDNLLQGRDILHPIEGNPALNDTQVAVDEFHKDIEVFQDLNLICAGPGQVDVHLNVAVPIHLQQSIHRLRRDLLVGRVALGDSAGLEVSSKKLCKQSGGVPFESEQHWAAECRKRAEA